MTKKSLRQRIRDLTDSLPEGEWLRAGEILRRLPAPKPHDVGIVTAVLKQMVDSEIMVRRGTRQLFEYRSGTAPIIDGRLLRKGVPQRETHHRGFAALARLERDDPEAWARETANDRGFKRDAQ
jgi:hypothetical protein